MAVSTEEQVAAAGADDTVILCRGTVVDTANKVKANKSAGGVKADANCGAPSEDLAKLQVGGFQTELLKKLKITYEEFVKNKPPEYSTDEKKAKGFASGALLYVAIKKKYLTKGSGSEDGWIALPQAPLVNADWMPCGKIKEEGKRLPIAD